MCAHIYLIHPPCTYNLRTHIHAEIHIHSYTHTYTHTHILTYSHTHVHTYVRTYMHAYSIHAYLQLRRCLIVIICWFITPSQLVQYVFSCSAFGTGKHTEEFKTEFWAPVLIVKSSPYCWWALAYIYIKYIHFYYILISYIYTHIWLYIYIFIICIYIYISPLQSPSKSRFCEEQMGHSGWSSILSAWTSNSASFYRRGYSALSISG